MKKYLRHPVVQNALALYSVQFAEYVLPMLTMPYLARILQPAGWGMVVYAQNFSNWIGLVLEYGFGYTATREIARSRERPESHADVVAGVAGANILLLLPAIGIAIVVQFTVPFFREHPGYLWLAVALAAVTGMRPFWYFQGIEAMKFPAWLNVFGRLFFTVGVFAFVRSQQGGWIVLALQAIGGGLVTAIIGAKMYRAIAFHWPTIEKSVGALKTGWAIFLSRSAVSLYTFANTFILGLFVDSTGVAYYGSAERIVIIVLGLMGPLTQALYPRMSHLAATDRGQAASAIRTALLVFGAIGLLTGIALVAAAPWIILIFGHAYRPATNVLRVAALIVPLVAISNVLGLQWMLPFGMDREFNRISISAGVLNIVLAVILAPRFGPMGTAWSVVTTQAFVTVAQCVLFFGSKERFPAPAAENVV